MGYVIKSLPFARRTWKVQFRDFLPGGRVKTRDISESEYSRLGFRAEMTIEEAKSRKDQLNAQSHVKAVEKKRSAIGRRIDREEKVLNAFLPSSLIQEFEDSVIEALGSDEKKKSIWRAAKRVLRDVKIEPREWNYHKKRFYHDFAKKQCSPSYVQKMIMLINKWGEFQAMKHGFYFSQLEFPKGEDLNRISEAYYKKSPEGRASEPITPEQLESIRSEIKPEWYNWFFLSIWFGLRPSEVDQLLEPQGKRTWWIEEAETISGSPATALAVYQAKLVKLPPDRRYKLIPVIAKQQREGLQIIKSGNFKRPSHSRYIKSHLGEQVYLYGGRKGFSKLMRQLGQDQVDYSRWLGHATIQRTEKDYEDKTVISFKPLKKR